MARYIDSSCRLCRREKEKLFLKGERCISVKCAIEKRNYYPGEHGQRMSKQSDYGTQLREKQKVKRMYGLMEKQFKSYFKTADRKKGVTGEILLQLLECRLDNVVHRLGFAVSRNQARQIVRHNHITVNGIRTNIASFSVKEGSVIAISEKSKKKETILKSLESTEKKGMENFPWLTIDKEKMQGTLKYVPKREELKLPVKEQLIVELYSK